LYYAAVIMNGEQIKDYKMVIKWRIIKWVEHVACILCLVNAYEILVSKCEVKRPDCKWEHNVKIYQGMRV